MAQAVGPAESGTLAGRTILITGGTSGTGLAAAIACHGLGADVVIGTRSHESYRGVAAQLGEQSVRPFIADLGDRPSLDRALDELEGAAVQPTDIVHCAAGGLEPVLRTLLRMAAGLRRMEPGPEREETIRRYREEITRLVEETSATATNVNFEGPLHLVTRLAPALHNAGKIVAFASVWSDARVGACPAFYRAVADSKTRFERWLEERGTFATVLVGHIISDTSTGKLIDRNLVPLMSPQHQAEFRAGYVTTAEVVAATTTILTEAGAQSGAQRRVYLVGPNGLTDHVGPEVAIAVGRVPL